ncbi:MAG TPA: hypothetical protein VF011_05775 [Terriglobales bacterium]
MAIRGIEGLSPEQINFELQRGGKFVVYQYCISLLVVTLRRGSPVYLVRDGESRVGRGLPWILLTCLLGWWGIPWGPIFTIQSLVTDFGGGKDVTAQMLAQARQSGAAAAGNP